MVTHRSESTVSSTAKTVVASFKVTSDYTINKWISFI